MAFTAQNGRTSTSLSEINVTPLVDVMLVLLVIFMVTAPMLQTGIDVELPETKNVKEVNPEERIIISINQEGLILRADKDVKWNSIVSVIDVIRGAGFDQIKLVTKPFKEPSRK
jgi:biopolymer transport protein TolR